MKKTILYTLASTGLLMLAGCNEEWSAGSSGEGRFNPVVSLNTAPSNSTNRKAPSRSTAKEISVNDLALKLTSTSTGVEHEWTTVADFDPTREFNVGPYTLEAYYGNIKEEGFDKPHYYGKTQFTIRENETTPVALEARLANAMLSMTFTDEFTGYFTAYSIDVQTPAGNTITWAPDENRPVYAAPGAWTIVANVTKPNGTEASYTALTFNAEACHHYHLTLNVNEGNVGSAELVLSFDDEMELEDVVIDLSQDLQNTPAPVIKAEGFAVEPVTIVVGNKVAEPLRYMITAHGGIASAILETRSPSLIEQGWPESVNLIGGASAQAMTALGFTELGLWKNPDKLAVADLSDVIPNIRYIEGSDNVSTFSLTVTDRLGRSTEPVVLTVAVEKLYLALANPGILFEGGTELQLEMEYNGANPEDVVFEAFQAGTAVYKKVQSEIVSGPSRAKATYTVKVTGLPDNSDALKLRALVEGTEAQADIEVERTPATFALDFSINDVFANRATLKVVPTGDITESELAKIAAGCTLYDGVNSSRSTRYDATAEGTNLIVPNLTPATTYNFYITYAGVNSNRVTFTTEAAAQLPNNGMEDWYSEKGSKHWDLWYPMAKGSTEEGWTTYNPVTTSQGTTGTTSYRYKANSGTMSTTDTPSGDGLAAVIRTVGWGSNNTAAAISGFGTCKYVDAGQLCLGNWDGVSPVRGSEPNYGKTFNSRPSSISFMCKYKTVKAGNGDYGKAEVALYDAEGNIIASNSYKVEESGEYHQVTLPLSYGAGAAPAAEISVIFKSSDNSGALVANATYMTPPPARNLSTGEYVGSQLYIDDIILNY